MVGMGLHPLPKLPTACYLQHPQDFYGLGSLLSAFNFVVAMDAARHKSLPPRPCVISVRMEDFTVKLQHLLQMAMSNGLDRP